MDTSLLLERHKAQHKTLYQSEVLDPREHYLLIEDLQRVCEKAGIRQEFIARSAATYCGLPELQWMKRFRQNAENGVAGFCYVSETKVEDRMMALAAVCLRNYINARVMTLNDVLTEKNAGIHDDPTALFIPNFCTTLKDWTISQWDASSVYDLLLHRYSRSLQTVVAISTFDQVDKLYGRSARDHLTGYYEKA